MRTLIACAFTPTRDSGRGVRTYGLVRALLEHGPADLVYVPFGADEPALDYVELDGLTLRAVTSSRGARRALTYGRAKLAGAPEPLARSASPELAAVTEELAGGADRVVAEDPMAAVALWRLAGRRPVLYSAHNLESAFRTDWGPAEKVARFEGRLLEHYAEAWMPSRADAEGAAAIAPRAAIRYVPNVVDVAAVTPGIAPGRRVLFIADFRYAPNREGFDWLVAEVLPLLGDDVELHVVGRGIDPPAGLDPRVRLRGFVDDLEAVYAEVACAVVPLLTGGGSPLKFVEALAHGLPVVATPRAARGLEATAGEHFLLGDGPAAFADALARALDPVLGGRLGAAARDLAEREYSIESLAAKVAP